MDGILISMSFRYISSVFWDYILLLKAYIVLQAVLVALRSSFFVLHAILIAL